MKHILFINTQAFGDCIFGINAARRYKEDNPDHLVSYCITDRFNLTTNDGPAGAKEVLEVFEQQPWLDAVGVVSFSSQGQIQSMQINRSEEEFKKVDRIIMHYQWFSDLGISRSTNHPIKLEISNTSFEDGDIKLHVTGEKPKDDIIRVGIAGPLDWNRKLQSESLRLDVLHSLKSLLDSSGRPYEITMFGVEIANYTLSQTLQILNRQNLFIAPAGSLIHAAAALNVDTITLGSVFPAQYESPEFYASSGWHKTIKALPENHCGDFKCIVVKNSSERLAGPGNPPATLGFWPRYCPHTETKLSCTKSYKAEQVVTKIKEWIDAI